MAKHAKLSASGSKRWFNCPGSINFYNQLLETCEVIQKPSTSAAMEGTCAHLLGEICVANEHKASDYLGRTLFIREDDAHMVSEAHPGHADDAIYKIEVDDDMAFYVQEYVDYCLSLKDKYGEDAESIVEKYFDLKHVHPELGGTADFTICEPFGTLEVVDLKYGKGVMVEVEDNTQLKIYALGALKEFPECEEVKVTIVQPRKKHKDGSVRSITYSLEELKDFKRQLLLKALNTKDPNAPLKAGEHCDFCPCTAKCPEMVNRAQEQAKIDFDDEPEAIEYEVTDIGKILKWLPTFDKWLREVAAAGQRELERGHSVEGQKLVRKKKNRIWTKDEKGVCYQMKKAGLAKKDCMNDPKLKSPAQMEKLGKDKKLTAKIVAKITDTPDGDLVMAPTSDPRPAVEPYEEFDDLDNITEEGILS